MKLADLNKEFGDAVDKYTTAKAGINKEIATSNNDKHGMPERSGNQDTPVDKKKQKLLGTNPLGSRDKVMPTNLAT